MVGVAAATTISASDGVSWHAGARSGLVGLIFGSGLSTSAWVQRSGDAGYLRAQILTL